MKIIISFMLICSILFCSCSKTDDSKSNITKKDSLTTISSTNIIKTTLENSETQTEANKTSTVTSSNDVTSSTTTVVTTSRPTTTTTTTSPVTTSKSTSIASKPTTTTTTTTSLPQTNKEARLDVTPVKSKYYASASAFACVEMAADYFGYTAKQDDVIKHLIIDDEIYKKNGRTYIGAPDFKFIGDPSKKDAIGSTALPIEHAILKYFEANNINLEVLAPAKISFFRLEYVINEEKCLIMWIADDVEKCTDYYVKDDINDVVAIWPDNMTCMLLIAASKDSATFYDPATNKEITMTEEEYNKRACQYTLNIKKQTGL